jgi:hypothetical protein
LRQSFALPTKTGGFFFRLPEIHKHCNPRHDGQADRSASPDVGPRFIAMIRSACHGLATCCIHEAASLHIGTNVQQRVVAAIRVRNRSQLWKHSASLRLRFTTSVPCYSTVYRQKIAIYELLQALQVTESSVELGWDVSLPLT